MHLPHLPKPTLPNYKIIRKTIGSYAADLFVFVLWFALVEQGPVGVGNVVQLISDFPARSQTFQSSQIGIAAWTITYRKLARTTFFSLSFEVEVAPKIFFLACRAEVSALTSESLVVRISLLRFEDLRSKVNWNDLIGKGLWVSMLENTTGEARLASRILRIPWKDIDKIMKINQ